MNQVKIGAFIAQLRQEKNWIVVKGRTAYDVSPDRDALLAYQRVGAAPMFIVKSNDTEHPRALKRPGSHLGAGP